MTMIDVKTAVRKAVEYVREFGITCREAKFDSKETEFVDPGFWRITLSFADTTLFGLTGGRSYKVFRIDANTGEVLSMTGGSLAPSA